MKLKTILLVVIIFFSIILLAFSITPATNKQSSEPFYPTGWGTLSEYAQQAKKQGKKQALISAPYPCGSYVGSFSEALTGRRVLIVKMVAQKSYPLVETIVTWHKFKIIEDLSADKSSNASDDSFYKTFPAEIDGDLLPVEEDEILVRQAGGTVKVDGVTLTSETHHFPLLSPHQKYLIFVTKESLHKIGSIDVGPGGVFTVTKHNHLNPLIEPRHPIGLGIKEYYDSSLDNLRMDLSRRNSQN